MLDGLNFKEFVAFLSAFSPRTSPQQKIECRYHIPIKILHYLSICSVDVL